MKYKVHTKNVFLENINPVVKFLILSDIIIVGTAGLLGPIFALFIEDFIIGGNEAVAGIAAGVFLFSRSILQIPVAHMIDKIKGERDDYYIMVFFMILSSIIPISYLFISLPYQLYIIQFILGIASAFTFPPYMAIFARHIDSGNEGTEWGVYFTLTDIVSALLAGLGGYMAATYGFHYLIISVSILMILGAVLLYPIKKEILVHPKN
jgi:MFS family permease